MWRKGVSGNPGGRPKSLGGYREWLAGTREQRQKALLELLESRDEKVRLEAIKHADAYDYGRPMQAVEVSTPDGPLQVQHQVVVAPPTPEELAARVRLMINAGIIQAPALPATTIDALPAVSPATTPDGVKND